MILSPWGFRGTPISVLWGTLIFGLQNAVNSEDFRRVGEHWVSVWGTDFYGASGKADRRCGEMTGKPKLAEPGTHTQAEDGVADLQRGRVPSAIV